MIANSATRVSSNTSQRLNQRIEAATQRRLAHFQLHPHKVPHRLRQLDREWDIERVIETNSSSLTLAGIGLTLLVDRRWIALPIAVQLFLLQHALQGWCPPVPILRRLGFRTQQEIEAERQALLRMQAAPSWDSTPSKRSDAVEEDSENSFPASDPPGWIRSTATPASGS